MIGRSFVLNWVNKKTCPYHLTLVMQLRAVRYITSNQSIYRTKHARGKPKEKVRTGIYFNYSRCGNYPSSKRGRKKQSHTASELVRLDAYLKTLLFSPNSEFSADILAIQPQLLSELRRLCNPSACSKLAQRVATSVTTLFFCGASNSAQPEWLQKLSLVMQYPS